MLTIIMRVLGTFISVYILLILIRVILTWFQGPSFGKPHQILARLTDPYLNYFRRFPIFRVKAIDFSPVVAILSLSILGNIFHSIAFYGRITLGIILSITLSAIWSVVAFLFIFFLILSVVRTLGLIMNANSMSPFWRTLDTILEPLSYYLVEKIPNKKKMDYRYALLICAGLFLLGWLIGGFIINQMTHLLVRLPF